MRFTDKEFFDFEMANGLHPGNANFYAVHKKVADYILKYKPNFHADLGAGNSPLCKILQDNGVESDLFESNPYSCELQKEYGVKYILDIDFIDELDINGIVRNSFPYDFITSIEVFEHIPDKKLLPFVSNLINCCKYFLFSSTPYPNTPEFDEQWGHVNLKQTEEWIRIFTEAGFELLKEETDYLQKNEIPTKWTLMFKSNA
jgi:2-polyprenyl-3-methyl-5-hydroxy-6-metoxy-1,4-benzoquinol methylase